ncbi:putative mitochondrial protein [Tanacetum coccineum]
MEYLGHVISAERVSTETNKIKAMQEWPIPSNLKQLRGFLGLTGYYRRFIKGFASLSRPLTQLLKKIAFKWSPEEQDSFEELRKAMIEASILGLPDFNEPFIIETDALGVGLGANLQQKGHPITYLSYLLDRNFIIKIDHFSLKYLLDQRITTPTQMKWLPKLIGYDYEVIYKKGLKNGVADALCRLGNANTVVLDIITTLQAGQPAKKHYSCVEELWYNTNFHTSINTTPFEVVYGQTHLIHVPYMGGLSKVDAVDRSMLARENVIKMLKFHLQRSLNRMKQQADKSRTNDNLKQGKNIKFSQNFYGPFKIIAKVGQVAYKLKLHAQAQIHDVFHISQLKKYRGPPMPMDSVMLPQCDKEGTLLKKPLKLLDKRIAISILLAFSWLLFGKIPDYCLNIIAKLPYCREVPIYHEPLIAIVVSASVVDRSIGTNNPHPYLGY